MPRKLTTSAHQGGIAVAVLTILLSFFLLPSASYAQDYPPGYPVTGAQSESIVGLPLAEGGSQVATRLFPVYTRPGETPDQLAYCIEKSVAAQYEIDLFVNGWDEFPGKNNFSQSAQVRENVAWIVNNSYPNVDLENLRSLAGIPDLSIPEAIAGTQAAIWTYTDSAPASANFVYEGVIVNNQKETTTPVALRVSALIDYLTGAGNTGVPEVQGPALSVSTESVTGQAGSLVGPFVFHGTSSTVELVSNSTYPVVLADGSVVDLDRAPTGVELFLEIPHEAPAAEVTISASMHGPRLTGMLVTNTKPRTQTLMIARSDQVSVTASLTASWSEAPRIGTIARAGDSEHNFLPQTEATTVYDLVMYENLIPGKTYQVTGELMIKDGNSAVPTGITASTEFTPEQPDGDIELAFEVPANTLMGETIVVFERLYQDGIEVATHTDIEDIYQTVYRPNIETDAYDLSDLDQELEATGGTLRDDVAYSGLRVGERYILRGQIMDHDTGNSTGIIGQTEFVAEQPSGIAYIDFEVPAEYAGKTLVVFEYLYFVAPQSSNALMMASVLMDEQAVTQITDPEINFEPRPGEELLAVHTDLDDERQTVTVSSPPTDEPPVEEPPVVEPPVEEPPVVEPPVEEPPVKVPSDTTKDLPQTGAGPATIFGATAVLLLITGMGLHFRVRKTVN